MECSRDFVRAAMENYYYVYVAMGKWAESKEKNTKKSENGIEIEENET